MIKFASGVTMTCAATDLAVGLVLIPFTVLLSRMYVRDETEKQLWIKLMKVLSAVCITGFIVHGIIWSNTAYNIIWVGLYAIMIMAVRRFFFVAAYKMFGENGLSDKLHFAIDAVSIGMYIVLSILKLMSINPIRLFTVYGILLIIPGFVLFGILGRREGDSASKLVFTALIPQLIGAVYILHRIPEFKFIVPMDHNCIYHLCLFVSVIIFYYAAKRSLLQERINEEEQEQETFV